MVEHDHAGSCPSEIQPDARDALCPACAELEQMADVRAERDRYRQALEHAAEVLADPNAMAEPVDSPANMAFAVVMAALDDGPPIIEEDR